MEDAYEELEDGALLSFCKEKLSRLKTPLSRVVVEERELTLMLHKI